MIAICFGYEQKFLKKKTNERDLTLGGQKTFPSVGYLYDSTLGGQKTFPSVGSLSDDVRSVGPKCVSFARFKNQYRSYSHPYPQNEAIPCARAVKVRPLLTIGPNGEPLGKSLGQRMVCSTMGITVNQHPPMRHEGWMISSQETVFCYVPVNPS
jgi:hypothetical protein